MANKQIPEYHPRRPLSDAEPDGYMESDNDYFLNNVGLAVALLDIHGKRVQRAKKKMSLDGVKS